MLIAFEIPSSLAFRFDRDSPDGVEVSFPNGINAARSEGFDPLTLVVISAGLSVPAGVLTGWILRKLEKQPPQNVSINRRQIDYDEAGQIKHLIEEEIRYEQAQEKDAGTDDHRD